MIDNARGCSRRPPQTTSLALLSVSMILFACGEPSPDSYEAPSQSPSLSTTVAATDPACADDSTDWGYTGESGPDRWAELSPCFELCSSGREQSPVDFQAARPEKIRQIRFGYQPAPSRIINHGHSIQVNSDGQSNIEIGETSFILQQFHFHSPSEHAVKGRHSPMEMHMVHSSADGELAVVAVFLEIGEENDALAAVWDHFPAEPGPGHVDEELTVRTAALLPPSTTSYRYTGSLTTPPCTEGVRWIVLSDPLTVTQEQHETFRALFPDNSRPEQPLGDRQILTDRGSSSH